MPPRVRFCQPTHGAKTGSEQLSVRKESINLIKGSLNNQIASIKETITKVLDKDASLGEKIRTLFREQGITIVSILTAFGANRFSYRSFNTFRWRIYKSTDSQKS